MAERETEPGRDVAVAELVDERYEQMTRYAQKRLWAFDVPSAWAGAEDVVHNALENVLTCRAPIKNLRSYVYRVIENEARRAAQRYRASRAYRTWDADVRLEAAGVAVDPWAAADLQLEMETALHALPTQQRAAFVCTKSLGLTQAETAQVMGKNPGTVATHVSRAIVTLKVVLGALAVVVASCAGRLLWSGRLIEPAAGPSVVMDALLHWWMWEAGAVTLAFAVRRVYPGWRRRMLTRTAERLREVLKGPRGNLNTTDTHWLYDDLQRVEKRLERLDAR